MLASAVVYAGLVVAFVGLVSVVWPIHPLRISTRLRGVAVVAAGVALAAVGLILPAPESQIGRIETRIDEFMPVWQFSELHTIEIAASPTRAFEAMKAVTADEIFLFRALTWIRRGGRPLPESILNAAKDESLIDVATRSGFVRLAEDFPRELVIGTVVKAPPGTRGTLTPDVFRTRLPPGFALATMNFLVTPDGAGRSVVSTETRVFANSPSARRGFTTYWRVIYPGSAIIRRMWLRAIKRRATTRTRTRRGITLDNSETPRRIHMPYVDGFVLPVAKKNVQAYRRMAERAGRVWRKHGALEFRECVGDDLNLKKGMGVSFPRRMRLKRGETVFFSWIVFKSRAHRDRVNAKVMNDPQIAKMMNPKSMPMDPKRMLYGGFKTLVDL